MSDQVAQVPLDEQFEYVKQRSLWLDGLERLVRNKMSMLGLIIAVFIVFLAIFGPSIAPYDYLDQDLYNTAQRPDGKHWFGTDLLGRDVLSRVMWGARTAVLVAVVVLVISTTLGVIFGAVSAFIGGLVDDVIMRITDATLAFPDLLLAAFLSTSVRNPVIDWITTLHHQTGWAILAQTLFLDYVIVFGALSLVGWAGNARLIRGQILSLREQDFIRAERALGAPPWLIVRSHLIPNAVAPVVVSVTLSVGGVMLSEASLSFLGLGIQPPGASWGNMVNENLLEWRSHPYLVAIPGLVLASAVFGFNFLGDGINDALNPRQIRR